MTLFALKRVSLSTVVNNISLPGFVMAYSPALLTTCNPTTVQSIGDRATSNNPAIIITGTKGKVTVSPNLVTKRPVPNIAVRTAKTFTAKSMPAHI
ncbi:uncharacterized protein METZ01_LOCUS335365, partial [marine metagenome]